MRKTIAFLIICLCCPFFASAEESDNGLFRYEVKDGYAQITGFAEGQSCDDLVIPSVIDGYEVKNIGYHAFSLSDIKNLIIEKGIKEIDNGAFSDCNNLESVTFAETVEEIGSSAFSFCKNLSKIKCPASLKIIGDGAFSYCSGLRQIELNEGLETIYSGAVSHCENLREVVVPSTVKILSRDATAPAIEYCDRLEKIVLKCTPDNPQIFVADCPALKAVVFEGDIGDFDYSGIFKYNFYECQPRAKMVNARNYTTKRDIGIYGKKGSNTEKFAVENGLNFVPIWDMENENAADVFVSPWAKDEVEKAEELGFVPASVRGNYKKNITRQEFTQMAMYFLLMQYGYQPEVLGPDIFINDFVSAYCGKKRDRNGNDFINKNTGKVWKYEDKQDIDNLMLEKPFADLDDSGEESIIVNYAYNFGIVNGVSETKFNPEGEITRQEAAAMLMRIYKNYSVSVKNDGGFRFSDDDKIAEWAKKDVYAANVLGVMQGVAVDVFAPLEKYSVEQAVVTFFRLYDRTPISRKNNNIELISDYE